MEVTLVSALHPLPLPLPLPLQLAGLGSDPAVTWKWLLLGGLAAGVLRFVWGAVCWMVLKHHDKDWRAVGDGGAVEAALAEAALQPGAFHMLPHHKEFEGGMQGAAFQERLARGPNAILVALPKGGCMGGATFVKGFLLNLVEGFGLALLVTVLWSNSAVPVASLAETMLACGAVGFLAAVSVHWTGSVWMGMPWRHAWTSTIDLVVGYALAGALLSWLAHGLALLPA